ncbi:hypothetical protein [Dietzia sp. MNB45]|uniref:hypothetical protein n=1 Tax=Dietzia sp. MNB45 TaxID=3238800 RepID=UPI003F80D495
MSQGVVAPCTHIITGRSRETVSSSETANASPAKTARRASRNPAPAAGALHRDAPVEGRVSPSSMVIAPA